MGGPAIIDDVPYYEFDNFYESKFIVDGVEYRSSEQYFQCQKAYDPKINKFNLDEFKKVFNSGYGIGCWSAGSKVKNLRKDWEMVKVNIMYYANKFKIEQNLSLLEILVKTEGIIKLEESTTFWNFWNARILERIRAENRQNDNDNQYLEKLKILFEDYENGKVKDQIYSKKSKY